MHRAALVALGAAIIASSAIAQSTGVPACDDFFKKYETCLNTKIPAAERDLHKPTRDMLRKAYSEFAKSPEGKPLAEKGCKESAEQFRSMFKNYGCEF